MGFDLGTQNCKMANPISYLVTENLHIKENKEDLGEAITWRLGVYIWETSEKEGFFICSHYIPPFFLHYVNTFYDKDNANILNVLQLKFLK